MYYFERRGRRMVGKSRELVVAFGQSSQSSFICECQHVDWGFAVLSSKRRLFDRFSPVGLQETPPRRRREQKKVNHSQPVSPAPTSPPFLPFSRPPPLTISPPPSLLTHTPPHSVSPSILSRATIGLLFMASPIEDALLYKTLEPSSRPTPFEDVAHNSYLGL